MHMRYSVIRHVIAGSVAVAGVGLVCGQASGEFVVDTFEEGPINPPLGSIVQDQDDTSGVRDEQTGLDPAGAIGGVRAVEIGLFRGSQSQISAALQPDSPHVVDDGVEFVVGPGSSGFFFLDYEKASGEDLADLRANGESRFVVTFAEAPAQGELTVSIRGDFPQAGNQGVSLNPIPIVGPGQYTIPYDEIVGEFSLEPFDFTFVRELTFIVLSGDAPLDSALTYTISDIRAVPEPATAVTLLGASLIGLAPRRQRFT